MLRRKYHRVLLAFSALTFCHCFGDLPEDPTEYAAWEVDSFREIEEQKNIPLESSIPKLGSWILKLSQGTNREKGERPVFHAAQNLLLSMPGHATYFQNKLESLRAKTLEALKINDDPMRMKAKAAFNEYDRFRENAFRTLGLLPSSETVAVLGHFLNDPEGRDGKDLLGRPGMASDYVPFPINAGAAAVALRKLGIEHPPFREHPASGDRFYTPEEIDAWKDWWNEVKEGKRTYRFIGSSIEYGPDGPASKEQLQRIERNRQREAASKDPRSAVSSAESDEKPNTKTGVVIGGAVLVLLTSILYVLKAKKRSSR
jgi:hypothetical protein